MNGHAPALLRFRLLLGLRFRLTFRSIGRSGGRTAAFVIAMAIMLVWGTMLGLGTYAQARSSPQRAEALAHFVFFSVFTAQVILGVVSLVVSEFFDVSRILHLPVGYREVFAAMALGGIFAPMTILYASPAVGLALGLGGGAAAGAARLLAFLLLLLLGHGLALLLNLVFLTLLSRRKLRDIATIVASLIGVGFYVAFRTMSPGRNGWARLLDSDPTAGLRWLPSSWAAELFLGAAPVPRLALAGGGVLVLLLGIWLLGARALRAAFLGQMPSPEAGAVAADEARRRDWLPGDVAIILRTARKLYFREPQVKALYLQQTVFMLAPVLFIHLDRNGDAPPAIVLLFMLPMLLAFSHMVFMQSLFGLDGRGLGLLLLTPVPRWRVLLARGMTLAGFFLLADLVVTALALLVSGLLQGSALALLPLLPKAWFAVAIFDIVMLAFGTVTSVAMPIRLVTQGRRALSGQRSENAGCSSQLLRLLLFFPAVAIGGVLAFVALWPVLDVGIYGLAPDPSYVAATAPLAFLLALGLWALAIAVMGDRLQRHEERLVRAFVDTGE